MKIKDLKKYGIPSSILNIWEKNPSPYLLPLQEDAVKNYGILSCGENLLVIAPTSSGKSFIGEMAAISQATHHKKIIYLLPLRSPAEEKYRHFKNLYSSYGIEAVISTRNHREEDYRIIRGTYEIAVMAYEKFNYFLLKDPEILKDVSLVIIDEMQAINHPKWGPLLEDIIEQLHKKELTHLRIIGLSAFIENQKALLKWFPIQTQTLLSYQYPVKLRKGMVRDGTFEYITSNKKNICICRKEIFFKPKSVRDNSFEDYLLETLKYLMEQGESTLIFFTTRAETRHWAELLASCLKFPTAPSASPSYWRFIFSEENIDEEINNCLHILKENNLIIKDSNGNLSLTPNGILIAAKRIKVETYLFLKAWLHYTKKGEISNLEILYLLSQTPDGKEIPSPFTTPQ